MPCGGSGRHADDRDHRCLAGGADPLVGLIGAQRLAAALAERKGIDPDQRRALSRSVILA
jgi:CRISPR-associated protein Cas5a/b/c